MKTFLLAGLLLATPAAAEDSMQMVYGLGANTCGSLLPHDWMAHGEFSWIQGYMTAATLFAPTKNGHKEIIHGATTVDLAKMVFKQCKHDPRATLQDATSTIAFRLLKIQGAGRQDEDAPDHEEGQQF